MQQNREKVEKENSWRTNRYSLKESNLEETAALTQVQRQQGRPSAAAERDTKKELYFGIIILYYICTIQYVMKHMV